MRGPATARSRDHGPSAAAAGNRRRRCRGPAPISSASVGTAKSGVPMKARRRVILYVMPSGCRAAAASWARGPGVDARLARGRFQTLGLLQLAQRHRALELGEVIDEQHAFEMVHLVLQAGGEQPVGFEHAECLPSRSRYSALMRAGRSTSSQISGTERQPSSNIAISSDAPEDFRIDEGARLFLAVLLVEIHHDDALGHADLHRGQADAVGLVHAVDHVVDQPADLVIDLVDVVRDRFEARIGRGKDGADGHGLEIGEPPFPVKIDGKPWNLGLDFSGRRGCYRRGFVLALTLRRPRRSAGRAARSAARHAAHGAGQDRRPVPADGGQASCRTAVRAPRCARPSGLAKFAEGEHRQRPPRRWAASRRG